VKSEKLEQKREKGGTENGKRGIEASKAF